MQEQGGRRLAGGGESGTPLEPTPARRGGSSRRYSTAERKRLLDELERSGERMADFCARQHVSTATICAWKRALRAHGEAGLVAREPRRNALGRTGPKRSADERRAAIEAYAKSGMTLKTFARAWGLSPWTLRTWVVRYEREGPQGLEPRKRGRPRGSGPKQATVSAAAREEIARTKTRFPEFGLKKVRDFLKRFQGIAVSTGTVRAELDRRGIERERAPKKRPKKRHAPRRFERARPGELWQSDITSFVLTRHSTRVYLVAFVDDHSRFVVSWALSTHQRAELVSEALMDGVARFGKPKEVLTDQGRQYFAWRGKSDFQKLLLREGIAHVVARTHHPETLGKCERLWETVGREFWERAHPQDLGEARERLAHFFAHYNFFRPHQGIDGLVPADRFFGAESALRKTLEARLSRRELEAALEEAPRKGVYLFGQIGDEQVALSGEHGELVLHTSSGVRQRIGLEELGAPSAAPKETSDAVRSSDGERDDRSEGPGPDAGHGETPAAAHGQEAAEVRPPPALPARSQGAVDERHERGAGERAPDVHADPGSVAGQEAARGSGAGALDPGPACLAAQPAGALGDAGGSPAPASAAACDEGALDGSEGGRPADAEEEDRGAGEPARGPAGADPPDHESAQAAERVTGAGGAGAGVEKASAPHTSAS